MASTATAASTSTSTSTTTTSSSTPASLTTAPTMGPMVYQPAAPTSQASSIIPLDVGTSDGEKGEKKKKRKKNERAVDEYGGNSSGTAATPPSTKRRKLTQAQKAAGGRLKTLSGKSKQSKSKPKSKSKSKSVNDDDDDDAQKADVQKVAAAAMAGMACAGAKASAACAAELTATGATLAGDDTASEGDSDNDGDNDGVAAETAKAADALPVETDDDGGDNGGGAAAAAAISSPATTAVNLRDLHKSTMKRVKDHIKRDNLKLDDEQVQHATEIAMAIAHATTLMIDEDLMDAAKAAVNYATANLPGKARFYVGKQELIRIFARYTSGRRDDAPKLRDPCAKCVSINDAYAALAMELKNIKSDLAESNGFHEHKYHCGCSKALEAKNAELTEATQKVLELQQAKKDHKCPAPAPPAVVFPSQQTEKALETVRQIAIAANFKERTNLAKELDKAKTAAKAADDAKNAAVSERDTARDMLKKHADTVAELRQANGTLTAERDEARTLLKTTKENNAFLEQQLRAIKVERDSKQETLDVFIRNRAGELANMTEEHKINLDRRDAKIADLTNKLGAADLQLKGLEAANRALGDAQSTAHANLATRDDIIKRLQGEVDAGKTEHATLDQKHRTLVATHESLSDDLKAKKTKCADLQAKIADLEKYAQDLHAHDTKLTATIGILQQQVLDAAAGFAKVQADAKIKQDALEKQLQDTQRQAANVEGRLAIAQAAAKANAQAAAMFGVISTQLNDDAFTASLMKVWRENDDDKDADFAFADLISTFVNKIYATHKRVPNATSTNTATTSSSSSSSSSGGGGGGDTWSNGDPKPHGLDSHAGH